MDDTSQNSFDIKSKAEIAVSSLLELTGDDITRKSLQNTPNKVVTSYNKLYSGYTVDIKNLLCPDVDISYSGLLVNKDINFQSMCEHHLLPFFGKVHVGIWVDNKTLGLSRLCRFVNACARRLQTQESFTQMLVDHLVTFTKFAGVAVVVQARHMCVEMLHEQGLQSEFRTSIFKGVLAESGNKEEFLSSIRNLP